MDEDLVAYMQEVAINKECDMVHLDPSKIELSTRDRASFGMLAFPSTESLRLRAAILILLNVACNTCLRLVDARAPLGSASVGSMLRKVAYLGFPDARRPLLRRAVVATTKGQTNRLTVKLSRQMAQRSLEAGLTLPSRSQCMFVQMYRALRNQNASILRSKLDEKDRLFEVKYVGEAGMDWGGLYRDALSQVVQDLFDLNPGVSLFVPTPAFQAHSEGRAGAHGRNEMVPDEEYLPDPSQRTSVALGMFKFVGILMGISLRFESFSWKLILGE